ncbi:uncharacterized protein BKA78DRAFT_278390 [Phyllosticta capitalensis]|uniref:uncharacterized protein n=1 Tax=Phyllosticta capitalensis TaxID=121624 RepID=UPI00312F0FB2
MIKKFRSTKSLRNRDQNIVEPNSKATRVSSITSSIFDFRVNRLSRSRDRRSSPADASSSQSPRPRSKDRRQASPTRIDEESFGLHVVHQPQTSAPLDIIFVHGLGGHSQRTWSKHHDLARFWPGNWLPFDPELGKARILTFGYDANFSARNPKAATNVSTFAKELLSEMRFGRCERGDPLDVGKVPIVFVVHSMGGLVVKKAYLLGQNDEEYQGIIQSIAGILFLSTPHRGTDLAEILNRILTVSLRSPKGFVSDLARSSATIEEVNEQFRHIAPRLLIYSFYETLATVIGPKQVMILEKDSSVLGYPREISIPLVADHHDVCKYSSPQDKNYIAVLNVLKDLMSLLRSAGSKALHRQASGETKAIKELLAISQSPEDDFDNFSHKRIPGTCEWLFSEPEMATWIRSTQGSEIIWFNAPPGSGKSILASHLIQHLSTLRYPCQYFFFRFSHQEKRSLSGILRSLTYQIARDVPLFRHALIELSQQGLQLGKAESSTIWRKMYDETLFQLDLGQPLHWIFDALDESDSPRALLDLLSNVSESRTPIHIFIGSRKTETLNVAFDRLARLVPVIRIEKHGKDHNLEDIQLLVEQELSYMRGSIVLKEAVKQKIMARADGNFLWARLVLEEIQKCHTEDAIQEVLDEVPSEMSQLYRRIETDILRSLRKSDRRLSKALFQWAICSQRTLHLSELSQALKPAFPEFLDLKSTIHDICGQFIQVDRTGYVGMVHQTAREYFTSVTSSELWINIEEAHGELFEKGLSVLTDPGLRLKLTHQGRMLKHKEPFTCYAAVSWAYHLHRSCKRDDLLNMLVKFFESPAVLSWIHALALIGQMEILIKASKAVGNYAATIRKRYASINPMLHRLSDLEILDQWTVDLLKIIGKFSNHLLADPSAIYKLVPPFCPTKSFLHRQFYDSSNAQVVVSGISNQDWDDNLARISLPSSMDAEKIVCAGQHVAVLVFGGTAFVWNAENFSRVATLSHEEPVATIAFNKTGTKLVSFGFRTTKLWSIPLGELQATCATPPNSIAMTMVFAANDSKILAATEDSKVWWLETKRFERGWQLLNPALLKDTQQIPGAFLNDPMCLAFNGDATQIGASYRGFPLSVWTLDNAKCIARRKISQGLQDDHESTSRSFVPVDRFTWNPVTGHVIGLYKNGRLFKWHPLTDEHQEVRSSGDEIAASSNGKLFATNSPTGTVTVWNFAFFSIIYQLSSEHLVTELAFSPDATRFYDIRYNTVNVWEPNSLLRFSEAEEVVSDVESEQQSSTFVSKASEAYHAQFSAISTLAAAPRGQLYAAGDKDGIFKLHNAQTGESLELAVLRSRTQKVHLAWSEDSQHVTAYHGGRITVRKILLSKKESLSGSCVTQVENCNIDLSKMSTISDILFSHDSRLLFLASKDSCRVVSIDNGEILSSVAVDHGETRRWLNHPTRKELLLSFGPQDVRVFRWDNLVEQHILKLGDAFSTAVSNDGIQDGVDNGPLIIAQTPLLHSIYAKTASVTKAFTTHDRRYVLIQISIGPVQGQVMKRTLVFDISSFDPESREYSAATISCLPIPQKIWDRIGMPLGVLPGSRLVFLDPELWLCTYSLKSDRHLTDEYDPLHRHFFIPRDWLSGRSLELCALMEDGALLCPKNDQVAVIRGALR